MDSSTSCLENLSPFEEGQDGMYLTWRYKPSFRNVHRVVQSYLQMLILLALAIVPMWVLSFGQNDYYVASEGGMCLQSDGVTPISAEDYPTNEPPHCKYGLTPEAAEGGWMTSPWQKHAHRNGAWYQALIAAHIVFGCVLTAATFVAFFSFLFGQLCCAAHRGSESARVRITSLVYYYGFVWGWVANITVAIAMAFTRFFTLGSDATNWRWMFSSGFFVTFYFIVLIVLLNLNVLLQDSKADTYTVGETYLRRLTLYSAQGMFVMCLSLVIVLTFSPETMELLGMSDYDRIMLAVVTAFIIEPMLGFGFKISSSSDDHFKALAACTVYFITILTMAINLTYMFDTTKTVPVVVLLLSLYLATMIWTGFLISAQGGSGEDQSICQQLCRVFSCGCCDLFGSKPAPASATPGKPADGALPTLLADRFKPADQSPLLEDAKKSEA
ncbi:unnamed protein product [Symbiodinium natans]|uniref:Uncharacterized protein n=1 Tax=Symbiodinium natans TaxID=878477 RepID=A0A812I268_9DINO|nr:unnamed protein product [Symbiodinium natans]